MKLSDNFKRLLRHPATTLRLIRMLPKSAQYFTDKYFRDPEIIKFFDILFGMLFCATVQDAPAMIAPPVFMDAHAGGAYYPSGSPQVLPNTLEKALEKYGGQMLYRHRVAEILIEGKLAKGVRLDDGTTIESEYVVPDVNIWQLYGTLIKPELIDPKKMAWVHNLKPTMGVFQIFMGVDAEVIPPGSHEIEFFCGSLANQQARTSVCVFIPSLNDPSICPPGTHSLTVLTDAREEMWPAASDPEYQSEAYYRCKEQVTQEVLALLEQYYPTIRKHIRFMEPSTIATMERFTLKKRGNIGGVRHMLGQAFFQRQGARTEFKHLLMVGDSTMMGEGVVSATISAFGAVNLILRDKKRKDLGKWHFTKDVVQVVAPQCRPPLPSIDAPLTDESAKQLAIECQWCEKRACSRGCPAGIDVLNFIRRVEAQNFAGAARTIREMNPLGEVCGIICPAEKLCQNDCYRKEYEEGPVAIAKLQEWVCQRAGPAGFIREAHPANGIKTAVVGAGPAGLSCAHFLARLGYAVDLFEKADKPGGMIAKVIPEFRLSRAAVQRDIDGLLLPNIHLHCGKALGSDVTIAQLKKDYQALFLAPGLWAGRRLPVKGAERASVTDALSFIRDYQKAGASLAGKRILVIGGGSVAADAAAVAKRARAGKVTVACLEAAHEMPCLASEKAEMQKEGVEIVNCCGPHEFTSPTKLIFVRCTSVLDEGGHFCPAYDETIQQEVEFDLAIFAVGQALENSLAQHLKHEFGGTQLRVDATTQRVEGRDDIFAGGDLVRGAGTVVAAVGDGRRAAIAIHRKLIQARGLTGN